MAEITAQITGIVLAGGKSSRMGFDKGLAGIDGKKMIDYVIDSLRKVCENIIIVSNTNAYEGAGWPVYKDIYQEAGPLGGIFTGLTYSTTAHNLVLACDMPLVPAEALAYLLKFANEYTIVLPSIDGLFQPLCAYYHKSTLPKMEKLILQKTWKMQDVIRYFSYKEISVEQAGLDAKAFANVNTPAELLAIQQTKS